MSLGGNLRLRQLISLFLLVKFLVLVSSYLPVENGAARLLHRALARQEEPQQRDVTHRLMITRLRSGATSMAIISRRSASLMAARTFALPTLARSAICATGRVHFPVVAASFRMTASTAIASVFRCSPIEGGTTTVAARNRRPRTTRWTVSDLLLFSTIRVSILETPGSKRGGSPKIRAADFGQRPLSCHA